MRESARVLAGFLRRDLLVALTYRGNLLARTLSGLSFLFIAWFTARTFAGREPPEVAAYGGYFGYLLFGMVMADAGWALMTGPAARVREAQLAGTLEIVVAGRLGAARLVAIEGLNAAGAAALRAAAYVGGAALLLDVPFRVADPLAAALAIALSGAALLPIGLIGGAVTLLLKRADPIGRAVHGLSMLAGGVIYPASVLPGWLAALGQALAPTHALRALRGTLLGGADLRAVSGSLLALAILAGVGGVVAVVVLRAADRLARRFGSLHHY
jgi:ABC-2 type transport system permease protein